MFGFLCLLLWPLPASGRLLRAQAPGDVIIGGLFPLHLRRNRTIQSPPLGDVSCDSYDFQIFLRSEMMMFAIDEVNQRTPRVLPGVTLGYDVYDTCGDVSLAMRAAIDMSADTSDPAGCCSPHGHTSPAHPDPRVKVVIGGRASEVSVAVARVLTLSSIPQISYASTSEVLSRKSKFPTFLRTVSSDAHQTRGIAALVERFGWETVGVVGSDDEYGKYGSERLLDHLGAMGHVCLDFKVILHGYFKGNGTGAREELDNLMNTIRNSTAEAVVLFTEESNVILVFEAAIRMNLSRTWIASDSWSNSAIIMELPGIETIGSVFGFNFKNQVVPGFADHIRSMGRGKLNPFWEYHLSKYPPCSSGRQKPNMSCSLTAHTCMETTCLAHYIEWNDSFSVYLAVEVITHALRSLMRCDSTQCQRNTSFTAYELFDEIKNVNLTVNDTHIEFDENGDPTLGYDVVEWHLTESKIIGEYRPGGEIDLPQHLVEKMRNVTVTAFGCSKTCSRGYELLEQVNDCCKKCVKCRNGHFSPNSGKRCQKCKESEYSPPQQDRCLAKTIEFLQWKEPFIIILCVFNILGIMATVLVVVIFVFNRRTPIVKAVGGYLCFLELFSLLTCFCLSFGFILKPTRASCMAGMPLFGIAFTLCVSCILANLLQILVGFNFAQNIGGWLKRLNQPPAVVAVLFGVQLILCSLWLAYHPPSPQEKPSDITIVLECNLGCKRLFGAMFGYVGLLAVVCFLFAFNGRRLPDLYKNANFVTIGMLFFLVVWIVFLPIYIQRVGKYTRAIEAAAVLVSSYSMLTCHLVPKCYIMVCRRELNDQRAITDYIKKHYEQKGITVLKS